MSTPLLDLDPAGILHAMEGVSDVQRTAALDELLLALAWADLHSGDPQDEPNAVPTHLGGDKLVDVGGDGTPRTSELCWSEFAIARQAGDFATRNLAADALDLRHRLPLIWAAVQDLVIPAWLGRKVAAQSRKLDRDQVGLVDAAIAAAVHEAPGRILTILEAKVIEADPAAHEARLAEEAAKVAVRLSRPRPGSTIDELDPEAGTRKVFMNLSTGAALGFDATVDDVADRIAETPEGAELTRDQLRAEAVRLLSDPHAAAALLDGTAAPEPSKRQKRSAVLHLHISDLVLAGHPGVLRGEGIGPVLTSQLADLLGDRDVTVTPVIDLRETTSVNSYEHPTLVKTRTMLRMVGEAFPHSTSVSRKVDHDHCQPYDAQGPPGQTGDHNDAPLLRRHHRAKTHLSYDLCQLQVGVYRWVTPHGLGRLVTRAGTRGFTPLRGDNGKVLGELYRP